MQLDMSNGNTTADSWVNHNESLPLLLAEEANMSNNNKNEIAGVSTKPEKTKRKQVKNACVNCQKACKKCDDGRPCKRCIKLGLTATCRDSDRKERKKGVKRGPYRKRQASTKDKPVYPKLTDDWTLASTLSNQLPASIQALSYQNTWSPSVSPISSNSYDELEEDFSYIATQPGSNSLTRPSLSPILSGFGSEEALHYNYPFGYIDQKQSTNGSFSYSSSMLDHQPIIGNTITSSKPESITELNSVKGDTPIGYGPLAFPSQSISQYTFGQHGETTLNSDHQKIPPTSQYLQLQEADYLQPNTTTFWNIPYGQHQPYYYGATASEYH